jgi:hypothetical protein
MHLRSHTMHFAERFRWSRTATMTEKTMLALAGNAVKHFSSRKIEVVVFWRI